MVILLAAFIDLLLPNRTMQRYVKLMMSLIILLILLSPVIKLFDAKLTDELAEEWEKASADSPAVYESLTSIQREAARISTARNNEVLSVAATQLETNMKAQLQQYIQAAQAHQSLPISQEDAPALAMQDKQADVTEVDVQLKQDSTGAPYIDKVNVYMTWIDVPVTKQEQDKRSQQTGSIRPIDKVQPVKISETMNQSSSASSQTSDKTASPPQSANHSSAPETLDEAYKQSVENEVVKQLTAQWLVRTEQIQLQWQE